MRIHFFLLLAFLSVLVSCNEEITIGSNILEDNTIEVDFNDTLDIDVKTLKDDSIVVFNTNSDIRTYLLGELSDPTFGYSKSELYLSTSLIDSNVPDFDTLTIDSVIMILPLDTLGLLGDESAQHEINVFQLDEALEVDEDNNILSSYSFSTKPNIIGSKTQVINHYDSISISLATNRDSFVQTFPQLRIPMDVGFWRPLLLDTMVMQSDSAYTENLKGFKVTSSTNNSIAGVNLSSSAALGLIVYFTNLTGDVNGSYFIDIGSTRSSEFTHDYTGTPVESAFDVAATDFVYIQGMRGTTVEVDLANIINYKDTIINKASLEMFILDESGPFVSPIDQLDAYYINDEGNKIQIFDIAISSTTTDFFGGELESIVIGGQTYKKYELDITNQAIRIARGDESYTKIIVQAANKSSRANRSIVLGPDHPEFPIKLKLVTSNP